MTESSPDRMRKAKTAMTAAAEAVLRGDPDAVEKANLALIDLERERSLCESIQLREKPEQLLARTGE
jgi:hypothetical protein